MDMPRPDLDVGVGCVDERSSQEDQGIIVSLHVKN